MQVKTVLLVYGSGGHNEQMKRLLSNMNDCFLQSDTPVSFVSLCDEDVKHPITERVYTVPSVTDKFSYIKLLFKLPLRTLQILRTLHIINKTHPVQYVITTGPGIGVLAGIYFKVTRKKIIHVETWSRFYSKSLTGRFMYSIADHFFIQNKELLKLYPKAQYKGRL